MELLSEPRSLTEEFKSLTLHFIAKIVIKYIEKHASVCVLWGNVSDSFLRKKVNLEDRLITGFWAILWKMEATQFSR